MFFHFLFEFAFSKLIFRWEEKYVMSPRPNLNYRTWNNVSFPQVHSYKQFLIWEVKKLTCLCYFHTDCKTMATMQKLLSWMVFLSLLKQGILDCFLFMFFSQYTLWFSSESSIYLPVLKHPQLMFLIKSLLLKGQGLCTWRDLCAKPSPAMSVYFGSVTLRSFQGPFSCPLWLYLT